MREDILLLLKDHSGYVSGEDIAVKLKISRASIWKYVQELRSYGYLVDAVPHLGYKLTEVPDKLYPWEIAYDLHSKFLGKNFYYLDTVDSTMEEAFHYGLNNCPEGTVIAADYQLKGRGRFNRIWVSPKAKGLYFSFILKPELSPQEVSKLTLLAGVGCLRAFASIAGLKCSVKWPNDILVHGKKLCGILTEVHADQDRVHFVVVGVGINVNASEKQIPDSATSIFLETGHKMLRQDVLKRVLENIETAYCSFLQDGFAHIRQEWAQSCDLWGKRIKVHLPHRTIEGQALDIDENGCLIIRTDFGLHERIVSGDIATLDV